MTDDELTESSREAIATAEPELEPPGAEPAVPAPGRTVGDRVPFWLFVAFVAVAGPLIMFRLGAYQWFLRDEWDFLANRGHGRLPPLLKPNGGAHWMTVPRLIYLVLWKLFGVTTYKPYQFCVLAVHLTAAVMLRIIMRRSGVQPWLATAAAALLVLFGPGSQNIVWAFQVGFTGSLAFGLVQLVLADHEGPFDRRDVLAFGFGLLAIMSSGVGVTTSVAVGVALLIRRGWRRAAVQSPPLLVTYAIWAKLEHVRSTPSGRPSLHVLLSWDRSSLMGTFMGLGHFVVLAWVFVAIIGVGLAVMLGPWRDQPLTEVRSQLAMPVAFLVATLFFCTTTGVGRYYAGEAAARSSRYVYLEAALLLPLLAVAAQAIARRWRVLMPALVVVLLVPIAFNLSSFDATVFGKRYFDQRRYILTTAVRMPFAHRVPRSVQPIPDAYDSQAVTIGFLLTAQRNGQLKASKVPLTPSVVNEFRVRLGLSEGFLDHYPLGCTTKRGGFIDLSPRRGDVFAIPTKAAIATTNGRRRSSPPVQFDPPLNGGRFTVELSGLHLRIGPAFLEQTFQVCTRV